MKSDARESESAQSQPRDFTSTPARNR
jgi:hypothetical protein